MSADKQTPGVKGKGEKHAYEVHTSFTRNETESGGEGGRLRRRRNEWGASRRSREVVVVDGTARGIR